MSHIEKIPGFELAIDEIAEFTALDVKEVRQRASYEFEHPGSEVAKAWRKQSPKKDKEIERFYQTTDSYLYDLSVETIRPVRIAWRDAILMHLSQYDDKKTLLDFGGGIGTESIFFSNLGYETTYHDLPGMTYDFAQFRFKRYSPQVASIISREQATSYDVVISLEVLEHLVDPMGSMKFMYDHMNYGGLAFITQSFNLVSDDYPSHLSANQKYAEQFNKLLVEIGFSIIDTIADGRIMVLGKFGIVDIVLPIYNSYDYVVEAVESVRANTSLVPYRFIFVNDASTDKRIKHYLKKATAEHDVYVENPTNLGFVETANIGMSQSNNNDVVLLNTDTIASGSWLSSLQAAIYRNQDYATANPLTNNASIYSIPEITTLLEDMDYDNIGSLVSSNSLNLLPEIPVSVGFCMYIKRSALNRVGLLDPAFGRGYGEESDLCMRMHEAGLRHILVDNAFVAHKGSVSMLASGDIKPGETTVAAHEEIIHRRYPYYSQIVQDFINSGVMQRIHGHVVRALTSHMASSRKKILYVMHESISNFKITGGTEFHVRDITGLLDKDFAVYTLHLEEGRNLIIEEHVNGVFSRYLFDLPFTIKRFSLSHPFLYGVYRRILETFAIDIVHIHHLMNQTFDIISASKSLGIPCFLTVHDYYIISPDYTLAYRLGNDGVYSPVRLPQQNYFAHQYGLMNFDIKEWQSQIKRFLASLSGVIYPSNAARLEVEQIYGPLPNSRVIPHGQTLTPHPDAISGIQRADSRKFSVLFMGYVHAAHKGSAILRSIITALLDNEIEVHIVGSDPSYWQEYSESPLLVCHGSYQRDDSIAILRAIHPSVVVMASPWPETFSYTYSEALSAQLPVVAYSLGAIAERSELDKAALLVDDYSANGLLAAILHLKANPYILHNLQKAAKLYRPKSLIDNKEEYTSLYKNAIASQPLTYSESDYRDIAQLSALESDMRITNQIALIDRLTARHNLEQNQLETRVEMIEMALREERAFGEKVRQTPVYRTYKIARRIGSRLIR